jgi:hydrogenase maturation protease
MAEVLILGLGNPLRGDDGAGWRIASELALGFDGRSIEAVPCHQLTPELAERLAAVKRVIFVDAAVGSQPGLVRCETIPHEPPPPSAFSHRLNPPVLLQFARKMFGVSPEAVQVTVTGQNFDYAENLSAPVEGALPQLLGAVERLALHAGPLPLELEPFLCDEFTESPRRRIGCGFNGIEREPRQPEEIRLLSQDSNLELSG